MKAIESRNSGSHRLMESDEEYDVKVWAQMAEMGLLGLVVPEDLGGTGAAWDAVGTVMAEAGWSLLCAPFLSTAVLATAALLYSADASAQRDYLRRMADGSLITTFALTEDAGLWTAESVKLTARPTGAQWLLNGHESFVLDGTTAELILAVAPTEEGFGLFAVAAAASGLTRTPLDDRRDAEASPTGVPRYAGAIGRRSGAGRSVVGYVGSIAAACLAAEQAGAAAKSLEMAVAYAKVRHQFGRPIGSFQAIKHMCADMLTQVEGARSVAAAALSARARDDADADVLASVAKAYCSDVCSHVTAKNNQVHGGIGFTWEHPAHLYFKRARSNHLLWGDPAFHRASLAQRLDV